MLCHLSVGEEARMGCMSQKSPTEQGPSNGSSERGGPPIITGPEPHCHFLPNIMKIGGGGPSPRNEEMRIQ